MIKNKKSVGIIGCGKWGKKVIDILKRIAIIKFVCNSKNSYKSQSLNVDWVFVLTTNETHFKIVKFFLEKKKNVFCEKPLTTSLKKSKILFKIAEKNKVKLYVDDIENYKYKNISIYKKNTIIRKKRDIKNTDSLFFRLAYHDFYLLFDFLKNKKIIKIILNEKKYLLNFEIYFKNSLFNFTYDVNSNKKIHKINKIDFRSFDKNPLFDMINKVIYKKVNFNRNKNAALFANFLIDKFKNKFGI
tara:strand:+ start:844 stop:1575 length:732 start_codon:yes stop_codon:yes gene_type:complete